MRRMIAVGAVAAIVVASAGRTASAQTAAPPSPPETPAGSPADVQRMFNAYALLQAQEQLNLSEEQYTQFVPRFKALQDVRRKAFRDRVRVVQELRHLVADAQPDEGQLKDRLKALQDLDVQTQSDIRKGYDAIDQVLDVRQQAKFRIFEEQMERRQFELLARARQANRLRGR